MTIRTKRLMLKPVRIGDEYEFVILSEGKISGSCDADLSHSEDHS